MKSQKNLLIYSEFFVKSFRLNQKRIIFKVPFEAQMFRIKRPSHLDVGEKLSFECKLPEASSQVLDEKSRKCIFEVPDGRTFVASPDNGKVHIL